MDTRVGQLLAGWDYKFGAKNSFAAITADHGEHLNDHGIERGHGTLWITNLRIPLLIRCPGLIHPGTVAVELTRQIDVLPTILHYCGLPMPYDVQGMSLRVLIEGHDEAMRLVHQGQSVHSEVDTVTLRTGDYAFFFGDGGDLVHIFDRREDGNEEEDVWHRAEPARQSIEHSLRESTQE